MTDPHATTDSYVPPQTAVDHEVRALEALDMRTNDGLTYRQIAEKLGISVSTAFERVYAGAELYRLHIFEKIERERAVEAARLDGLWNRMNRKLLLQVRSMRTKGGEEIMVGDPHEETALAMVAISRERSRVLGLYAPTRIRPELDPPGDDTPDPLGDFDASKLSTDELRTFDGIMEKARRGELESAEVLEVKTSGASANGNGTAAVARQLGSGIDSDPHTSNGSTP